jgi:hypothetical protein
LIPSLSSFIIYYLLFLIYSLTEFKLRINVRLKEQSKASKRSDIKMDYLEELIKECDYYSFIDSVNAEDVLKEWNFPMYAVKYKSYKILKWLITNGAPIDEFLLLEAIRGKDLAVIKYLWEVKKFVNRFVLEEAINVGSVDVMMIINSCNEFKNFIVSVNPKSTPYFMEYLFANFETKETTIESFMLRLIESDNLEALLFYYNKTNYWSMMLDYKTKEKKRCSKAICIINTKQNFDSIIKGMCRLAVEQDVEMKQI